MEIIKVCKHHGDLDESQVRRYIRNRRGRSEETIGCKICHALTAGRARASNREKANEWAREDRKNNPEKYREQSQRYKKKSWQKISVSESLRKLGLTNEQYASIRAEQDGKCAICGLEETAKSRNGGLRRLAIDHCHEKLKVRGLLCHNCNIAIGSFKDDINLLQKAIEYLKRHQHMG